jgi:DNA-binding MarR family transcriptional regulator
MMNKTAPTPTLIEELSLLGEIYSTETALFHQTAASKLGLGVSDMKTLSILLREGPQSAGQIAERLSLTSGAVTSVINRLESRRFVTRKPDAKDGRKVVVAPNTDQLAESNAVYASIGLAFESLHQSYTVQERAFLVRYHKDAIAVLKEQTALLP